MLYQYESDSNYESFPKMKKTSAASCWHKYDCCPDPGVYRLCCDVPNHCCKPSCPPSCPPPCPPPCPPKPCTTQSFSVKIPFIIEAYFKIKAGKPSYEHKPCYYDYKPDYVPCDECGGYKPKYKPDCGCQGNYKPNFNENYMQNTEAFLAEQIFGKELYEDQTYPADMYDIGE